MAVAELGADCGCGVTPGDGIGESAEPVEAPIADGVGAEVGVSGSIKLLARAPPARRFADSCTRDVRPPPPPPPFGFSNRSISASRAALCRCHASRVTDSSNPN